jgi:hypothetical protein
MRLTVSAILNLMNDKILTLNPDPNKKGVKIDKDKYDFIHAEILKVLHDTGPIGAMRLVKELDSRIGDTTFGGSVGWYTTAVRLDMEAKNEILYNRNDKKPLVTLA